MRWFKHLTDSYVNLKHREIISDFGLEGYGLYWLCLELIGQQGHNYRLNGSKSWKKALKSASGVSEEKIEKILKRFGELNLICRKSLEKGDLYIPKMKERADEYSVRKSGEYREKVVLEQNRIDKNRIDIVMQAFLDKKKYPKEKDDYTFYYKRYTNTIKRLLLFAKGDTDKVIQAINWFGGLCDKKGLSWTLETIEKWLPEYLAKGQKVGIEAYIKD